MVKCQNILLTYLNNKAILQTINTLYIYKGYLKFLRDKFNKSLTIIHIHIHTHTTLHTLKVFRVDKTLFFCASEQRAEHLFWLVLAR